MHGCSILTGLTTTSPSASVSTSSHGPGVVVCNDHSYAKPSVASQSSQLKKKRKGQKYLSSTEGMFDIDDLCKSLI